MSDTKDIRTAFFVTIDHTPEPIRFHTGGANLVVTGLEAEYMNVGDVISLSNFENNNNITDVGFTLNMTTNNEYILSKAREEDIVDKDIVVRFMVVEEGTEKISANDLILIKVGKVSNCQISPTNITISCYTASSQLSQIVVGASQWADIQQKRFVDETDSSFRFTNRESTDNGVIFP